MKKLFLAFIAMGAMLFSMEASAQSSNTVYVCTGKYSVKYHKTNTCSGLSACTSDIVSTTVAAAKKNGKEECLKCYANAKAAPAKEVKKESRKEVKETSCIVVAENIAGSEEDFAVMMNQKAAELGLKNSHFDNSTGLPSPDHKMSVEDLAKLARLLIKEFPEFYPIFAQKSFTYHNILQGNRNPLLYSMPDADGLKTGHTEEAGFGLTASAKRGNRRIIGVMNGMSSNKERSEEAEKLMNWGFREFDNYKVFSRYQRVATVPVYMGTEKKLDLVVNEDVILTLPRNAARDAKLTAIYKKPVKAPIKQGERLGEVRLEVPGQAVRNIPLYADHNVDKLGLWGRIKSNISYLLFGK